MLVLGGGRSRAGSSWWEESCWFSVEGGVVLVLGGERSRTGSRWRNTKLLHTKTGYNGIYICPTEQQSKKKPTSGSGNSSRLRGSWSPKRIIVSRMVE